MATIEGAPLSDGRMRLARSSEGKRADMLLVDLRRPTLTPVHTRPMRNLVPNLVYAARGDEVDTVIVDGQIVVEHGAVLTLDEMP